MIFTPKTEEEIKHIGLLAPGIYDYEVYGAKEKVSENGNEMIELCLNVYDAEGKKRFVYDRLLESMAFKLRHFAFTNGLEDKYNHGELKAEDCKNKYGQVEIIIQKGKEKPDGSIYPDKNSVKDYLPSKARSIKQKIESDFNDDVIPF